MTDCEKKAIEYSKKLTSYFEETYKKGTFVITADVLRMAIKTAFMDGFIGGEVALLNIRHGIKENEDD